MEGNITIFDEIPKKRGKTAQIVLVIFAATSLLVGCCFVNNPGIYIRLSLSVFCMVVYIKQVLFRIGLLCEELKHLATRYDGDLLVLFRNVFSFSKPAIAMVIITSMYLLSVYFQDLNHFELLDGFGIYATLFGLLGALLINAVIELDYEPLHHVLILEKLHGLDYGVAMAHSYYQGFLKIVLPNKGTEQKGIQELMRDFESKEGVTFAHRKLIILIPMSSYCPPNLKDHSEIVELAQSLGEIKVSRGGVQDRSYKSTAYKIQTPTQRLYVCAEYASPLETLYEVISDNNVHANIYKKHKNELIAQFYLTLKEILDNAPECKDLCDLVLFNDKTPNNRFKDVGTVILNHLSNQRPR